MTPRRDDGLPDRRAPPRRRRTIEPPAHDFAMPPMMAPRDDAAADDGENGTPWGFVPRRRPTACRAARGRLPRRPSRRPPRRRRPDPGPSGGASPGVPTAAGARRRGKRPTRRTHRRGGAGRRAGRHEAEEVSRSPRGRAQRWRSPPPTAKETETHPRALRPRRRARARRSADPRKERLTGSAGGADARRSPLKPWVSSRSRYHRTEQNAVNVSECV